MTDVIVVGGGPAGATTAMLLARGGWSVLLLDRALFPRDKPCGDCIGAGAVPLLDRLGLLDSVAALPHARLDGWWIGMDDGPAFRGDFRAHAGGDPRLVHAPAVRRRLLDAALLRHAAEAGTDVRCGWRVERLLRATDGAVVGVEARDPAGRATRLRARVVVGADGLRSIVSRRLGLIGRGARLRRLSFTAHLADVADGAAGPRLGEMHLAEAMCVGLAPVGGGAWNLTLVVDSDRFGAAVAREGPDAFLSLALRRFPSVRERLADARCTTTGGRLGGGVRLLASGPFDRPVRTPVADGAALVGDAAGYFDPFTGQGIRHALQGAELLAAALDGALRGGRVSRASLRSYAGARARLLRGDRVLERGVDAVLRRDGPRRLALDSLASRPGAGSAIVAAVAGLIPLRRLIFQVLGATFAGAVSPPEAPA